MSYLCALCCKYIFLCRSLVVPPLFLFSSLAHSSMLFRFMALLLAFCLLCIDFCFGLAQLPKSMLHISHTAYTICAFYALWYFIYAHTHTHWRSTQRVVHTHTLVCLCFARISIVCTLCDIFMRPNFVASNLRCVWVTTAVAISLPHLWQIFSLLLLTLVLLLLLLPMLLLFCKPNDMSRKKHTCIY